MGDVEVESHPGGEENNMQEMQHEMNPDMAQMGGPHDPSRGPPEQVNYPGSEQHAQEGQPQEGRPSIYQITSRNFGKYFLYKSWGQIFKNMKK